MEWIIQGKVEAYKMAYAKLVDSTDNEEKWTYRERDKMVRKEAKLVVMVAKTSFEHLNVELEAKTGIRS